jgi:hypothetical protein
MTFKNKHLNARLVSSAKSILLLLGLNTNLLKDSLGIFQLLKLEMIHYTFESKQGAKISQEIRTLIISDVNNDDFNTAIYRLIVPGKSTSNEITDTYSVISKGGRFSAIQFGSKLYFVKSSKELLEIFRILKSSDAARSLVRHKEITQPDPRTVVEDTLIDADISLEHLVKFFGEEKILERILNNNESAVAKILKNSNNPNIKAKIKNSNLEVFK